MAKKINVENIVEREIGRFEDKLKEFQRYLADNSVSGMASVAGDIDLSEDNQDKIHKEILVQIKMQDAVIGWIPLLKKLRETEKSKDVESRGNTEIGGMFKGKEQ